MLLNATFVQNEERTPTS